MLKPATVTILGVQMILSGDQVADMGEAFEPQSLKAWAELCEHAGKMGGGTVLDIGAYTGIYALVAAKAGCHVLAFEPLKANRDRLRQNVELNSADILVNEEAVLDRAGTISFNRNAAAMGLTSGASVGRPSGLGDGGRIVTKMVPCLSVDSLYLSYCTAMKIDVERAEPLVLAGAQETLQRCRPALLVEVLGDAEKAAVRAAAPCYRVEREMDGRNWLMLPC